MPDYQNGKIYKITGTTDDGKELIYIGSTIQKLCVRFAGHKCNSKLGKKKLTSCQVLSCKNCLITLIELFPCNTKEELLMRERYYYDLYDCVNKQSPIQFEYERKEYNKQHNDETKEYRKLHYENNKEHILKYHKEYYEENKEIIAEKTKQYREKNKEILTNQHKKYYKNNKEIIAEKSKEHREKNKEILAEKSKEYRNKNREILRKKDNQRYENNKELIKQQRKETTTCECGCIIRKYDFARHKKSKIHIQYCESQL